jgi:hypothetical protein
MYVGEELEAGNGGLGEAMYVRTQKGRGQAGDPVDSEGDALDHCKSLHEENSENPNPDRMHKSPTSQTCSSHSHSATPP